MFSGKLLAVIASTLETGAITLRAYSPELASAEIILQSIAPRSTFATEVEQPLYADYPMESKEESEEIPIRKLEIICDQGNILTPDHASLPVRVKLHPSNASYQEVNWRITNARGNDTHVASIQTDGQEAVITAFGDGDIFIRCGTTNGADGIRLYSQMEFHLTGFGQACLNPYEFISSGYHSNNSINLTNGNERGVATAREGESRICFERVDFGDYGADEIILPIFSLDDEVFPIEIWEGIPGEEGAEILSVVTYQKTSRWNVYQEETYKLPKRLTGVTSLSFVLRRKIHLKGFHFVRKNKAYEQLSTLDNARIYGDTFTVTETAIEGIGNNVSLVFDGMDFGEHDGCTRITIYGRSLLENNTLHLLFSGPQGESKQLIEFSGNGTYVERDFILEPINGSQTVTFLFLPGSQFDFQWFQFRSFSE